MITGKRKVVYSFFVAASVMSMSLAGIGGVKEASASSSGQVGWYGVSDMKCGMGITNPDGSLAYAGFDLQSPAIHAYQAYAQQYVRYGVRVYAIYSGRWNLVTHTWSRWGLATNHGPAYFSGSTTRAFWRGVEYRAVVDMQWADPRTGAVSAQASELLPTGCIW